MLFAPSQLRLRAHHHAACVCNKHGGRGPDPYSWVRAEGQGGVEVDKNVIEIFVATTVGSTPNHLYMLSAAARRRVGVLISTGIGQVCRELQESMMLAKGMMYTMLKKYTKTCTNQPVCSCPPGYPSFLGRLLCRKKGTRWGMNCIANNYDSPQYRARKVSSR